MLHGRRVEELDDPVHARGARVVGVDDLPGLIQQDDRRGAGNIRGLRGFREDRRRRCRGSEIHDRSLSGEQAQLLAQLDLRGGQADRDAIQLDRFGGAAHLPHDIGEERADVSVLRAQLSPSPQHLGRRLQVPRRLEELRQPEPVPPRRRIPLQHTLIPRDRGRFAFHFRQARLLLQQGLVVGSGPQGSGQDARGGGLPVVVLVERGQANDRRRTAGARDGSAAGLQRLRL